MEQPAMTSDLLGEPIESGKRGRHVKAPLPTFVKYRLHGYIDEIRRVTFTGEDEKFYYQKTHRIEKIDRVTKYFDSWEEARAAMLERAQKNWKQLQKKIKALENKIPKIKAMVKP